MVSFLDQFGKVGNVLDNVREQATKGITAVTGLNLDVLKTLAGKQLNHPESLDGLTEKGKHILLCVFDHVNSLSVGMNDEQLLKRVISSGLYEVCKQPGSLDTTQDNVIAFLPPIINRFVNGIRRDDSAIEGNTNTAISGRYISETKGNPEPVRVQNNTEQNNNTGYVTYTNTSMESLFTGAAEQTLIPNGYVINTTLQNPGLVDPKAEAERLTNSTAAPTSLSRLQNATANA